MKINGKWYFNEHPVYNDNWTLDVSFVSNGKNFDSIESTDEKGLRYLLDLYVQTVYYWDMFAWVDEAYRTIDFGAAYQEVSDEFYTWLTANAVQLSKPIPMTHPKGIKLLTKGHKLSKDLEVVPTFAAAETVTFSGDFSNQSFDGFIWGTRVVNGEFVSEKLSPTKEYTDIVKGSLLVAECSSTWNFNTEGNVEFISQKNVVEGEDELISAILKVNGNFYLYTD